jgi:hypothetical protein
MFVMHFLIIYIIISRLPFLPIFISPLNHVSVRRKKRENSRSFIT